MAAKITNLVAQKKVPQEQTLPNITDIYMTGMQVEEVDKDEAETTKTGNLRAGNSAILTEDGHILGKCARKTWLRKLGIKYDSHPVDRLLMFAAGYGSEEIWYDKLSKGFDGTILREEEIPVGWMTENGVKVTGRPDMVLLSATGGEAGGNELQDAEKGQPLVVLEMKNVSSLWTARSVLFEETPKFDHLAQAGHYSWQLGIPGKICYSLYLDMAVTGGWATKLFPAKGERYSEYCDYSDDAVKTGKAGAIKKVKPFIRIYDIKWADNKDMEAPLLYRIEGRTGEWTESPITRNGIVRYYEMISRMDENMTVLPPRPNTLRGDGVKENWSQCNKTFCPLAETCDRHESNPKAWLDAVDNLSWGGSDDE